VSCLNRRHPPLSRSSRRRRGDRNGAPDHDRPLGV